MDLSVLIPTRGRLDKLRACLGGLASQSIAPDRFEVLVGIDGPDQGESEVAAQSMPGAQVIPGPHEGPAFTRNRLIEHAAGGILLWFNDDVVPHTNCLAAHMAAHAERAGDPALVVGSAPWRVHEPDRMLDRLIRESSMIFFYDRMDCPDAAGPSDRDWGFRHAWTLNLSIERRLIEIGGRFDDSLPCACYEDLEWAWRITDRCGAPVLYRPDAIVEHDHRYTWAGYLQRESMLGREAYRLARAAPECARAIFGRDVCSFEEVSYSRSFVQREACDIARIEAALATLMDLPASILHGPHAGSLVESIYLQHIPVKRWYWRRGLLEAATASSVSLAG
ncbi:MAG: glycosyltransferase [Phycisphaeraceae bacterium]|nr:glycosyltransferase [Phycisphaeraceae bacterium]